MHDESEPICGQNIGSIQAIPLRNYFLFLQLMVNTYSQYSGSVPVEKERKERIDGGKIQLPQTKYTQLYVIPTANAVHNMM